MRFFLDENFPKAAHELLVRLGHEVVDIRGSADEGAEDGQIFEMAQRREAAFLTTDKDFFHTVPHL
jgi:predicted nuclease of predicted toxin-antitoxin system